MPENYEVVDLNVIIQPKIIPLASQIQNDSLVDGAFTDDALNKLNTDLQDLIENGVPGEGGGPVDPGEDTTLLYALSSRRLVPGYASHVAEMRRADGQAFNLQMTGDGDPNISGLANFLQGQAATWGVWKNQTGGPDFFNPNEPVGSFQPFYSSKELNGRPALIFDGSRYLYPRGAVTTALPANYTFMVVCGPTTTTPTGTQEILRTRLDASNELVIAWRADNGQIGYRLNGTWRYSGVAVPSGPIVLSLILAASGATIRINSQNAVTGLPYDPVVLWATMQLGTGSRIALGELMLWEGAMSVSRLIPFETAASVYFGIGTASNHPVKSTAVAADMISATDSVTGRPVQIPVSGLPGGGGTGDVTQAQLNAVSARISGTAGIRIEEVPGNEGMPDDPDTDVSTYMVRFLQYCVANGLKAVIDKDWFCGANSVKIEDYRNLVIEFVGKCRIRHGYGNGGGGFFNFYESKQSDRDQGGNIFSAESRARGAMILNPQLQGPYMFGDTFVPYSNVADDGTGVLRNASGGATYGKSHFMKGQLNWYTTGTVDIANTGAGGKAMVTVSPGSSGDFSHVVAGMQFRRTGERKIYTVEAPINATSFRLTEAYALGSASGVRYRVGCKPMYQTGFACFINGQTKVYGDLTAFITGGVAAGHVIRDSANWPDHRITQGFRNHPIAAVDSNSLITLSYAYDGDTDFVEQSVDPGLTSWRFDHDSIYNASATLSITQNSNTITGVNTLWKTKAVKGHFVFDASWNLIGIINAVNTDTTLTLKANFTGTTITSGQYYIVRPARYAAGIPYRVNRLYQYTTAGTVGNQIPEGTGVIGLNGGASTEAKATHVKDVQWVGSYRPMTLRTDDVIGAGALIYWVVGAGTIAPGATRPSVDTSIYHVQSPVSVSGITIATGDQVVTGSFASAGASGWVVFSSNEAVDFYGYTKDNSGQITLSKPYAGASGTVTAKCGPVCYYTLEHSGLRAWGTDSMGFYGTSDWFVIGGEIRGFSDGGIKNVRSTASEPEQDDSYNHLGNARGHLWGTNLIEGYSGHSMTPGGAYLLDYRAVFARIYASFKFATRNHYAGGGVIDGLTVIHENDNIGIEIYAQKNQVWQAPQIFARYRNGYAAVDISVEGDTRGDADGLIINALRSNGHLYGARVFPQNGRSIRNFTFRDPYMTDYTYAFDLRGGSGGAVVEGLRVTGGRGRTKRANAAPLWIENSVPLVNCDLDLTDFDGVLPLDNATLWQVNTASSSGNRIAFAATALPVAPTSGSIGQLKGTQLIHKNAGVGEFKRLECVEAGTPGRWRLFEPIGAIIVNLAASTTLSANLHADRLLVFDTAAAGRTLTLPNDALPGTSARVLRRGANAVTVAAASGATLLGASSLSADGQAATATVVSNSGGAAAVWAVS